MQRLVDGLLGGNVRLRTNEPTCRSKDGLLFLRISNTVLSEHSSELARISHSILKGEGWTPTGNFASSYHEFSRNVIHFFSLPFKTRKRAYHNMQYHCHSVFWECKRHHDREVFVTHYKACTSKRIAKYTVIFIYSILDGDIIH